MMSRLIVPCEYICSTFEEDTKKMCSNCMDESTEDLIENTGIHPKSMGLIDDLCVSALKLGKTKETFDGDPLFADKLSLAAYVAALEGAVKNASEQLGVTPKQLGVELGTGNTPLHLLGVRDTNVH
jgi:hypothetical protein